jgi:DNA/RNA endonuclease G (NUC1)
MANAGARNRTEQDYWATFVTSNLVPQYKNPGNFDGKWENLEKFLNYLAREKNKEIYIVAGGDGQKLDSNSNPLQLKERINFPSVGKTTKILNIVPENVWKVVLVLDKPGMGISDVTENTLAFALYLPNDNNYDDSQTPDWKTPIVFQGNQYGLLPVRDLENKIKYNFLGNLPIEIQDVIETQTVGDIISKVGTISTP